MPLIVRPMHGVDFSEMTSEGATRFHHDPRERFEFGCHGSNCGERGKSWRDWIGRGGEMVTYEWYLPTGPFSHGSFP
jgi:hypothetical protein